MEATKNMLPMGPSRRILARLFGREEKFRLLRWSIGLVYLWFGSLKFFEGFSPAEALAVETLALLCQDIIPARMAYMLLAFGESVIGLALLGGWFIRAAILMALAHMGGTFMPIVLMPEDVFNGTPYFMTMIGQYIVKNLIIISALLLLYPARRQIAVKHLN